MASLFRDALRSECQNDDHDARNIVKLTSPSTAEEVEEEETRSVSTSTSIEAPVNFRYREKVLGWGLRIDTVTTCNQIQSFTFNIFDPELERAI